MNFYRETISAIFDTGHALDDIKFIGIEKTGHCCTWEEFQALADFEYKQEGNILAIVDPELVIIFSDNTRMTRKYKNNAEIWSYTKAFSYPKEFKQLKSVKLSSSHL
ncbi:hypothetical protein AB4254_08075 [Vibrio breoganii]